MGWGLHRGAGGLCRMLRGWRSACRGWSGSISEVGCSPQTGAICERRANICTAVPDSKCRTAKGRAGPALEQISHARLRANRRPPPALNTPGCGHVGMPTIGHGALAPRKPCTSMRAPSPAAAGHLLPPDTNRAQAGIGLLWACHEA
jgi:hypothetical protein